MATDLTALVAKFKLAITATVGTKIDLATREAVLSMVKSMELAFGTGLGACDQIFWDRRAIAGGGNDPLDLVGTLINPLGGTVNFANVKGLAVFNQSDKALTYDVSSSHIITDAGIVVLDTGSTFAGPCKTLAKGQVVEAGGMYMATRPIAAGWSVTATTGDTFQVDNEDGADEALYDIILIGESVA